VFTNHLWEGVILMPSIVKSINIQAFDERISDSALLYI
jgi:hypothetical protein